MEQEKDGIEPVMVNNTLYPLHIYSQFDTDNCDNSHWLQYYNPMRFHPGVIFRPDELQLCRRDGILHRGGISLGCNIVINEIPPQCDIPSRRVTTMPSGRNIAPGWNLTGL